MCYLRTQVQYAKISLICEQVGCRTQGTAANTLMKIRQYFQMLLIRILMQQEGINPSPVITLTKVSINFVGNSI
jgi:hypothetical protein